jgi:outer membrane autotransporter protein
MVVAGFVGSIVPLTETVRFDLRGTLAYQRTVGEAHADSLGIVYGDHVIEAADAILAARLLGVYQSGDWTIRPFLQAGVTHHLRYNNQLEISDVAFRLHEADTSVFAAAGLDFEINKALQLSVGLRQDYSDDYESVTGRLGFSARLN